MPGHGHVLTPELDAELREYLGLKREERLNGYTNEAIKKLLSDFSLALNTHIDEDRRNFADIRQTLQAHHIRIESLEAKAEIKPIPSGKTETIKPPSVTDTGSYRIDPQEWQKVEKFVSQLQEDKKTSDAVQRELTKKVRFWWKVAAAAVAIGGPLATAFGWALHHFH